MKEQISSLVKILDGLGLGTNNGDAKRDTLPASVISVPLS